MELTDSDLKRLNKGLAYFGTLLDGRNIMRWFRTPELEYFVEHEESFDIRQKGMRTDSGLVVPRASNERYEKHTWAERMGEGYVLAKWNPYPPQSADGGLTIRLGKYRDGYYAPIENSWRPYEDPPEERHTALLKHIAQEDLETDELTIRNSLVDQYNAKNAAIQAQIMDEIDDLLPAFGAMPGKRGGGVSFGGIS